MNEYLKRLEYTLKCFFYKDGTWEMDGHFISNWILPLSGYWISDEGVYSKYEDIGYFRK